jgi:hypothetical protein
MDLSKLSDADLAALEKGEFGNLSEEGLVILSGQSKFQHGFMDSVLQGGSFGFSDEIGARIDSLRGKGGYDANYRDRAISREQYERSNPKAALAGELAGSVGTAFVPGLGAYNVANRVGTAARLVPAAVRYGSAAVGGATAGAVAGAGTAEPGERLQGAGMGALVGGAVGPVATAGLRGIGHTAQAVKDTTAGIPYVGALGTGISALGGATLNYGTRAQEKFLQALRRDQMSPDDLRAATEAAQRLGPKPETLVDRGGVNTRGLAESATRYPGEAQRAASELASERMTGQMGRIRDDLSQAFRVQGDPKALSKVFSDEASQNARPLYEQAYREGSMITDPRIAEYMRLPAFQKAYGTARRLAQYDGIDLPTDPRKLTEFNLQTLDYVKRGLDDVLYTTKIPAPGGVGRTERAKIIEAQKGFMGVLDEIVPTYAQARQAYAGPIAMRNALEDGQKFVSMSRDEFYDTVSRLSPAEMDQFKIGALASIRDRMSKTSDGRDLIREVYGSPDKRELLKAVVGDEQFGRLEQQFARERAIRRTDDTIRGNSRTATRQAGMADLEADTTVLPAVLNQGLMKGGTNYLLRSGTGVAQPTADALSPMLFSTNPQSQMQTIQQLLRMDQAMRARAAAMGSGAGTAGGAGSAGGLLGN